MGIIIIIIYYFSLSYKEIGPCVKHDLWIVFRIFFFVLKNSYIVLRIEKNIDRYICNFTCMLVTLQHATKTALNCKCLSYRYLVFNAPKDTQRLKITEPLKLFSLVIWIIAFIQRVFLISILFLLLLLPASLELLQPQKALQQSGHCLYIATESRGRVL